MKMLSVAAAVAAAACVSAASAADMGPYRALPPPAMQEFGSGWYLRGDVGWSTFGDLSVAYYQPTTAPRPYGDASLGDTWLVGAGFGYKAGWFRSDFTVDYRSVADFKAPRAGFTDTADLATYTTMLNAYLDLGSWAGITPYIGAGLGGAYTAIDRWYYNNQAYRDNTEWTFAWSAMAGVAVSVGPNVAVDIGYRFLDLGEPKSGFVPANNAYFRFDEMQAHEVRIGLRYIID